MEINKQLFEDVLAGKLKGIFVLRNGDRCFSAGLHRNYNKFRDTHPYAIGFGFYTSEGMFPEYGKSCVDIIDFIPETNMKENELTIEIPSNKVVDWEKSKKQNKIILKDKQVTYEDVCEKLFRNRAYYTDIRGKIGSTNCDTVYLTDPNNATTEHQLECLLAKNKLANVAKYLNDGWEPINNTSVWIIECDCYLGYRAVSIQAGSIAFNCYGLVIFKSKEIAQQAMEILGEETIKLALEPLGI